MVSKYFSQTMKKKLNCELDPPLMLIIRNLMLNKKFIAFDATASLKIEITPKARTSII